MAREPQYSTLAEKMENPNIPDDIKDLVRHRHTSQRNEIGQTTGALELAYRRAYQAGYEDRVMGLPPKMWALIHRKEIRRRDRERPSA